MVAHDEPEQLQFALALDPGQRHLVRPGEVLDAETRRYVERTNKVRLHQPMFRARVLAAYKTRCTVCHLGPGLGFVELFTGQTHPPTPGGC